MSTSKSAGPAKAIAKANESGLVGFNQAQFNESMRAMSEKRDAIDTLTGETQDAALSLIRLAETVAHESLEAGMDSDSISKGWSEHVRASLPVLHNDGCRFVEPSEKKEGSYVLSGYGRNVHSAALGFCQYPDELTVDGCAKGDEPVTISGVFAAVKERRAEDESDEVKAIKAAKAELAEAVKDYRAAATKGNNAAQISAYAEFLREAMAAESEETETSDADAESAEAETETDAEVIAA